MYTIPGTWYQVRTYVTVTHDTHLGWAVVLQQRSLGAVILGGCRHSEVVEYTQTPTYFTIFTIISNNI